MKGSKQVKNVPTWLLILGAVVAQYVAVEYLRGAGRAEQRTSCNQDICASILVSAPNLIPFDIALGIAANLLVALCAYVLGERRSARAGITFTG